MPDPTCRLCEEPSTQYGLCDADYQWVKRHKREPTEEELAKLLYRRFMAKQPARNFHYK